MSIEPGSDPQHPIDPDRDWVAAHVSAYAATNGREGSVHRGSPLLLLTTQGAKSGLWRRTALIFGEHDGDYLIVASMGGAPKHPNWYLNLSANPRVYLQVYDRIFPADARTASPEEKPELWDIMVGIYHPYADYQLRTTRGIPVVILTPVVEE